MKRDLIGAEILLVDDNPDDAEFTVHALTKANKTLRVHRLKDGAETLNYLFGRKPLGIGNTFPHQLVLLDLKLPKVDGLEVLRKIREDGRTKKIPVVVLSSSGQKSDISEAYNLGVNSYVVKPVDFERFVEKVSAIAFYWSQINVKPMVRNGGLEERNSYQMHNV